MPHSAVGSMLRLSSFQLFRCWFSSFDPQGCFNTRCNPTLGIQACNFSISPLQAQGGNGGLVSVLICDWTWVVYCLVRIHLIGIHLTFNKAHRAGFESGDFGITSCGSKVGTGGGIEYIFPFHGVLFELHELCSTLLLSNGFLGLHFSPLRLGLGIGWLVGFSLDITRMLGSILSPCQHFMGFSRHSIEVSDNLMICW